jgi:SAM-dependent methyltransferase
MRLHHCLDCAHVVNIAFVSELVEYDGAYDNSLHYSPTFAEYAEALASRLARTYSLAGKEVVEVGCGKGDFLRTLCATADAWGTGYDTSYDGRSDDSRVRFIRGYLDQNAPRHSYDFVVTRHVLEHLDDPYNFLVGLRKALACDRPVYGYVEVPDARFDFTRAGWDCIYPHVGYFNPASLRRLIMRSGFAVLATGTAFSGQFLYAEIATEGASKPDETQSVITDELRALNTFGARHALALHQWRGFVRRIADSEEQPVLWGAGARGTAFLAAVDPDRRLTVVDRNPAKHGRYLPTGHQVLAPEDLSIPRGAAVVLTNPVYIDEISKQLFDLNISARLLVA